MIRKGGGWGREIYDRRMMMYIQLDKNDGKNSLDRVDLDKCLEQIR